MLCSPETRSKSDPASWWAGAGRSLLKYVRMPRFPAPSSQHLCLPDASGTRFDTPEQMRRPPLSLHFPFFPSPFPRQQAGTYFSDQSRQVPRLPAAAFAASIAAAENSASSASISAAAALIASAFSGSACALAIKARALFFVLLFCHSLPSSTARRASAAPAFSISAFLLP